MKGCRFQVGIWKTVDWFPTRPACPGADELMELGDRTGGMEFQSKKVLKPVKVVVPNPERFLRKSGTSQPRMQAPKCTHSKSMLCVQCTPIVHCAGEDKWTAVQNMYSNPGKRRAARHVLIGPFYSEAKYKPTTHPELCWVQRLLQAYTGVKSHY